MMSELDIEELKNYLGPESYFILMALNMGFNLKHIGRILKVKDGQMLYKLIDLGRELNAYHMLRCAVTPTETGSDYVRGFNEAISQLQKESHMARCSKLDTQDRRNKLKALWAQGYTNVGELAEMLGASENTIYEDIKWLNAYYIKLVTHNPHIAEKQYAKIMKLTDEMDAVKQELWETVHALKSEENIPPAIGHLDDLKAMIERGESTSVMIDKVNHIKNSLNKVKRGNFKTKLEALSTIVNRIEKESKLLGMFDPQKLINGNYITKDSFLVMMSTIKTIIQEFVPHDKLKYAVERLKSVDVKELDGDGVIDAEVIDG